MKVYSLIVSSLFFCNCVFSQQATVTDTVKTDGKNAETAAAKPAKVKAPEDTVVVRNKKGREILPKKGDIGIGFNMIPIIDMFLDALNFNQPSPGAANIVQYTENSNNQIVGKYFLSNKSAIRVRFGVNNLAGSIIHPVQDAEVMYDATFGTADDIAAASLIKVEDQVKFTKSNLLLSIGYEKRRGYRRLQGFYGGEIGFGRSGTTENYTYGNEFSAVYPVEYTSNFNILSTAVQSPTASGRTERTLETRDAVGYRFGLRGFIGIEYFIFSKISISAEYGWGFAFANQKGQDLTREVYFNGQNGPTLIVEDVEVDSSQRQSGFSVDNNSGSLFSMNNTLGGNTTLSGGAGALTLMFYF